MYTAVAYARIIQARKRDVMYVMYVRLTHIIKITYLLTYLLVRHTAKRILSDAAAADN